MYIILRKNSSRWPCGGYTTANNFCDWQEFLKKKTSWEIVGSTRFGVIWPLIRGNVGGLPQCQFTPKKYGPNKALLGVNSLLNFKGFFIVLDDHHPKLSHDAN